MLASLCACVCAENNAMAMKLDLDEDSVAKAFDKQEERGRESSVEESGPTSVRPAADNKDAAEAIAKDATANATTNTANTGNANANSADEGGSGGMATSGSRTKLKISSFQNCISNGSTNPLFHIEKDLACNFIRDFLIKHNIDDITSL